MTKNGNLTEDSFSDFDTTKKAEYIDKEGFEVADQANIDKLVAPSKLAEATPDMETPLIFKKEPEDNAPVKKLFRSTRYDRSYNH